MLCGILRELHRATAHYDGPWALLCDEREVMLDVSKEGSQLGYWAYLYYLSKFYEMLDTVILALKKRPLEFLQMSAATISLASGLHSSQDGSDIRCGQVPPRLDRDALLVLAAGGLDAALVRHGLQHHRPHLHVPTPPNLSLDPATFPEGSYVREKVLLLRAADAEAARLVEEVSYHGAAAPVLLRLLRGAPLLAAHTSATRCQPPLRLSSERSDSSRC